MERHTQCVGKWNFTGRRAAQSKLEIPLRSPGPTGTGLCCSFSIGSTVRENIIVVIESTIGVVFEKENQQEPFELKVQLPWDQGSFIN